MSKEILKLLTVSEYNNLAKGPSGQAKAVLVSIPTSGWSETEPYSISINVDGVVAGQTPMFYLVSAGDDATEAEMDAVDLITSITTGDGVVNIEASKIPSVGFAIALYGLSNNVEYSPADYAELSGRVNNFENHTHTHLQGGDYHVIMQNDGNLVVYENDTTPIWTSKETCRHKLLWTNSDMNVAFAPQTISLDLSGYDVIRIDFSHFLNESSHISEFSIGYKGFLFVTEGIVSRNEQARSFTSSTTGIVFTEGYEWDKSKGTSDSTLNNKRCIPRRIYGIKY